MASEQVRSPPGPVEAFQQTDDLLNWLAKQFAEYGDIFSARAYGTNIYGVRDPELAHHVLVKNWTNYAKGQFIKRIAFLLGDGLMVSEGELWKRQRRMIQPAFTGKSIGKLAGLMTMVNLPLLAKWKEAAGKGNGVNVTQDVSAMALEVILRSIFSVDYEDMAPHFGLISEEPRRNLEFAKAFRGFGKMVLELADRRRKQQARSNDFLDLLMHARDPQNGELMPDGRMVNEVLTLIVAGHETTASTLNWTWYLVSQHPEVEARLLSEADELDDLPEMEDLAKFPYSRQVLDESMRLYPAGWLMTRKALGDDRLGQYFIPARSEVYISPYFIHRNPRVWDDPDRFDPDRFAPAKAKLRRRLAAIPFSAGPRNCIGEHFARMEMQIHLLMMTRNLRLRYIESQQPQLDPGVNLRSKDDFIMYPEARRRQFPNSA
jgi:cytochrome P450